jgi:ribosome-binding factor A
MTDHRNARLNEQFKREISHILSQKVRDPRVGPVIVTGVRVTPDLWLARVFVRPLNHGDPPEEMLQGLEAASAFIRRELGKVLRIRRIPDLRFLHDTTLDSAMRIEAVLKEVLPDAEGTEDEGPTDGTPVDRPGGRKEEAD